MADVWDDGPVIGPEQIQELIRRMGLSQTDFAERVLEQSQPHVNKLVNGKAPLVRGSTRVLLRWLMAVYGVEGGRAPVPGIPVPKVPLRASAD